MPPPTDEAAVPLGPPPPPPLTRERRLTLILRPPGDEAPGHTGGVGALLTSQSTDDGGGSSSLFSGSRDATVRAWSVARGARANSPPASIAPASCWRGHGGWVNALSAVAPGLVASGSADRTVKLWRCGGGGGAGSGAGDERPTPLVATLSAHADYVTCLASAPAAAPGRLASAGLGTQVLLWDVGAAAVAGAVRVGGEDGTKVPPLPADPATTPWRAPALEAAAARDSVYALAMDGSGSVIAAGGPSGALRLADARSGAPAAALRGHAPDSVVRAALLSPDGRRALSGGSDRTVRLWDVGMRRCIAVLAVHTDSVWAVAAGGGGGGRRRPAAAPALSWGDAFLSGGRDGRVYSTDARARSACLVCEGAEPVTALALDASDALVWVGRERAAGVEGWAVPPPPAPPPAAGGPPPSPGACVASPTAAAAAAAAAGGARPVSLPPGGCFPVSASPLVRARQAFTSDASTGGPPRAAPPPAAAAPALTAPGSGPPPIVACTVLPDRRHVLTQALDGSVDEWDVAAGAEAYASDLGWTGVADDLKVNCGQEALRAALAGWALNQPPRKAKKKGGGGGGGAEPEESTPPEEAASPVYFRLAGAVGRGGGGDGNGGPPPPPPPGPPPSTPPALVLGEGGDPAGLPWVRSVAAFTGAEPSPALIPAWAADAVLRGRLAGDRSARDAKVPFVLAPAAGSGLPALAPPRLSAPRVLPLRKVAAYAVTKLGEAGVDAVPLGVFWDGAAQAAADAAVAAEDAASAAAGRPPRARLELTIAGCAAFHDLSLAAARAHLWRRGDDLPITYRLVRAGDARAPRPVLKAPRE